ncbi:MAG: type VI secretion system tube protein Hcp [Planctomycetota bacterium]
MILLKFKKEIKGDATAAGFEDQINLHTVSFSASRSILMTAGKSERERGCPHITEINCTKDFDIASPELFMQSVSGDSLDEASLTYLQTDTDGNPQAYLVVTLTDPIVSSFSHSAAVGARASEVFTLNFAKIKLEYTMYTAEKAVKASPKGWDLTVNKAAA